VRDAAAARRHARCAGRAGALAGPGRRLAGCEVHRPGGGWRARVSLGRPGSGLMGGLSLSAEREALCRVESWLGLAGGEREAPGKRGWGWHGVHMHTVVWLHHARTSFSVYTMHCFLPRLVYMDVSTVIVIIPD